ncbi:c-type heme family protein [Leptothoe spongobia]|uniref:Circadian input-output histidine kinase CikA n=1 Tax=Leptothoe spongobia TAU-MAC 1115 TaxID=1967444 RepID=A0A947GHE2_9CYAN|nr:DUF3365 domain-containing protein [Leptothoe spongobia]MBT9314653.1 DUF3365 domain-containing protein [Leptothoe spongobia TAU-MAC 1115]
MRSKRRLSSLGKQFTKMLTIIFFVGIIASGLILSAAMRQKAEGEIVQQAEILIQTMNAVRTYTSGKVKPQLADELAESSKFIPETVPAYSAREVFEGFRAEDTYKDFLYKEATLNPTNPRDQADDFETQIVNKFRENSELKELKGYRTMDGAKLLYISRPLTIQKESCLECHGSPSAAPRSMISTYGKKNGFGWKLGETVAAQTIYLPSSQVFTEGNRYLLLVIAIFSGVFAVVISVINRLLKTTVIQPLSQLNKLIRDISLGQRVTLPSNDDSNALSSLATRSDEPGQLARAFEHMANEVVLREQSLSHAKESAEAATQAKSDFLANMSHELRTPLNAIIGYSEMLAEDAENLSKEDAQTDLYRIQGAGKQLLTLINSVLDLSKIESGRMELFVEEFSISFLVEQVVDVLTPLVQKNGNKLIVHHETDLDVIVADRPKVHQSLLNLLSNANKFTQDGTIALTVKSTTFMDQPWVDFIITDTGIGMTPEQQKTVFDAFAQADNSTTRQFGGTGLGLTITKQFIAMMGGEIMVESQLNKGSQFTLRLPQTVKGGSVSIEKEQPWILVLQAKEKNEEIITQMLRQENWTVKCVDNNADALTLAQVDLPVLALVDLSLEPDAVQCIKVLRQTTEFEEIPIIAIANSVIEADVSIQIANDIQSIYYRNDLNLQDFLEELQVCAAV